MKYILLITIFLAGCQVNPLSPKLNNRINNSQGEIDDIKNNQNGLMADLLNLKGKLDVVAKEIENIQNGYINKNNRNYGIQIFHGDGGAIIGFSLLCFLLYLIYNYRLQAIKYKKTSEIIGEEVKKLKDLDLENRIFMMAISNHVEKNTYEALNPDKKIKKLF
jgi:hypothetical protein